MARNADIPVNNQAWVELTDANVTSISAQNKGPYPAYLKATTGAVPTDVQGSIILPSLALFVNEKLADLWPGVTGADRVFALSQVANGIVMVSHA